MSNFECPVVRVTIVPHENADALEIAVIGGFNSIVKKGQFRTGDLAVYLPEQSVLPEWLLKHLGFWDELNSKGTLNGAAGNRIKAIKLRGVLSQGILLAGIPQDPELLLIGVETGVPFAFSEGESVSEQIGVTKYEPAVPVHMAGKIAGGDLDATIGYDFENIKKFPTLFDTGEVVVMTEKIHGTFVQIGLIPPIIWLDKNWAPKLRSVFIDGAEHKQIVTSKGQGAKGLLLDTEDATNLYVRTASVLDLWNKLAKIRRKVGVPNDKPIFLCGEIFGPGVQEGFAYGALEPVFRAFDIYVGSRSDGFFLDYALMRELCEETDVDTVPLLYIGALTAQALAFHTDGKTHVNGTPLSHMREGVVVKSVRESRHPAFGRKIAKSVSANYLLRKGAVTEFQ